MNALEQKSHCLPKARDHKTYFPHNPPNSYVKSENGRQDGSPSRDTAFPSRKIMLGLNCFSAWSIWVFLGHTKCSRSRLLGKGVLHIHLPQLLWGWTHAFVLKDSMNNAAQILSTVLVRMMCTTGSAGKQYELWKGKHIIRDFRRAIPSCANESGIFVGSF